MENHPIPQDVTGFKFRLIGSMTVKQFLYILGGCIVALLFYALPFPGFIKAPLILFSAGMGAAIAFVPIEGRPMDIMLVNFLKALPAENQFVYKKKGTEKLIEAFFSPPVIVEKTEERNVVQDELKRKRALLRQELKLKSRYKPEPHEASILSSINTYFNDASSSGASNMPNTASVFKPQDENGEQKTDERNSLNTNTDDFKNETKKSAPKAVDLPPLNADDDKSITEVARPLTPLMPKSADKTPIDDDKSANKNDNPTPALQPTEIDLSKAEELFNKKDAREGKAEEFERDDQKILNDQIDRTNSALASQLSSPVIPPKTIDENETNNKTIDATISNTTTPNSSTGGATTSSNASFQAPDNNTQATEPSGTPQIVIELRPENKSLIQNESIAPDKAPTIEENIIQNKPALTPTDDAPQQPTEDAKSKPEAFSLAEETGTKSATQQTNDASRPEVYAIDELNEEKHTPHQVEKDQNVSTDNPTQQARENKNIQSKPQQNLNNNSWPIKEEVVPPIKHLQKEVKALFKEQKEELASTDVFEPTVSLHEPLAKNPLQTTTPDVGKPTAKETANPELNLQQGALPQKDTQSTPPSTSNDMQISKNYQSYPKAEESEESQRLTPTTQLHQAQEALNDVNKTNSAAQKEITEQNKTSPTLPQKTPQKVNTIQQITKPKPDQMPPSGLKAQQQPNSTTVPAIEKPTQTKTTGIESKQQNNQPISTNNLTIVVSQVPEIKIQQQKPSIPVAKTIDQDTIPPKPNLTIDPIEKLRQIQTQQMDLPPSPPQQKPIAKPEVTPQNTTQTQGQSPTTVPTNTPQKSTTVTERSNIMADLEKLSQHNQVEVVEEPIEANQSPTIPTETLPIDFPELSPTPKTTASTATSYGQQTNTPGINADAAFEKALAEINTIPNAPQEPLKKIETSVIPTVKYPEHPPQTNQTPAPAQAPAPQRANVTPVNFESPQKEVILPTNVTASKEEDKGGTEILNLTPQTTLDTTQEISKQQIVAPQPLKREFKTIKPNESDTVKSVGKSDQLNAGFPILPDVPNVILGIIKDPRGKVLPNILVEILNNEGIPVRAFKTNGLGQFIAATPLGNGEYNVVLDDPRKNNEFENIHIMLDGKIFQPLEIFSVDAREKLRRELFGNQKAA